MADTVDDLHAAEDMAGMAVAVLATLMDATPAADPASDAGHALSQARTVLRSWDHYCRPTCGANGDPDYTECEEGDTCGCPCEHARWEEMAAEEARERDAAHISLLAKLGLPADASTEEMLRRATEITHPENP